jgi:formylglycine-generating enzyme required for sulfatase activity/uncharacterized caspase-like protein
MTKAKNWAIVVGVNAYKNIGRLEYANRDAEAMHDFFVKAKFDRVFWFADGITLPSSSEQNSTDPTSSDLVDFLHDRFSTKVPPLAPGDNCWFFFAGHGKRIDDCDYLLPIDYNPRLADHEKRAISVNFVRERLLKSGADNVILLLDACRTEGDRADGLGIGDVQPGAITIFSCQRNRKAYEIEALKQGAFTAALLEALQMPGERNCATVERLDLYLQRRVPQICKQHQKPEQVPATYVEPRQKSYLILLPEFATDQDVALLRSEAQEAELEETLEIAEQLWIRVIAATQGQDLRAIQAYARVLGKKEMRPQKTLTEVPTDRPATARSTSTPTQEPPPKPKLPTFAFEVVTVDVTGQEIARKPGSATYFREDWGDGVTLDMVKIPGGSFKMGAAKKGFLGSKEERASDDEFPQHEVNVKEFWMGKFVVTQAQWKKIASLDQVNIELNPDPSYFKGANLPVERVSWHEAKEFCNRLSRLSKKTGKTYDLPTEAQWEYACRARTTTPFHFGETITTDLANFRGTDWEYNGTTYPGNYVKAPKGAYREKTIAVDSFTPNAFGLYNMHGNVWEWCLDPWHSNYNGAPTHGSVWDASNDSGSKYRLMRGGSWYSHPGGCRSANRNVSDPAFQDGNLGFRVVCLSPRGLS